MKSVRGLYIALQHMGDGVPMIEMGLKEVAGDEEVEQEKGKRNGHSKRKCFIERERERERHLFKLPNFSHFFFATIHYFNYASPPP